MYKKVFDRNLQFQTMKHGRLPSFGKKLEYIYYTYSFRINISFTKSKLIKFKLKYLQKKKHNQDEKTKITQVLPIINFIRILKVKVSCLWMTMHIECPYCRKYEKY